MNNVAFTVFEMMSWAEFHVGKSGSNGKLEHC